MNDFLADIANEMIDNSNNEENFEASYTTAIYIDTAYGDFIVWVDEGSCLELEMMEQHCLDADLIGYKVTKRVNVN
jgi:hypothetical protein